MRPSPTCVLISLPGAVSSMLTQGVAVGVEANAVAASERGKRAYRFEASAKLREACAFALQRDLRSTGESLLLAAEILLQPFEPAPG